SRAAALLADAVQDGIALGGADLRLDRTLERTDDVAGRDLRRIPGEQVAAPGAALPVHQARSPQRRDELLEIRERQILALGPRVPLLFRRAAVGSANPAKIEAVRRSLARLAPGCTLEAWTWRAACRRCPSPLTSSAPGRSGARERRSSAPTPRSRSASRAAPLSTANAPGLPAT